MPTPLGHVEIAKWRSDNLSRALDLLTSQIEPIVKEHSQAVVVFNKLTEYLSMDLLAAETELEIARNDLRKQCGTR